MGPRSLRGIRLYSDDQGRILAGQQQARDVPKRGAEEPAVVELKNGSLLALLRTSLGKIYQTIPTDRGETWSDPQPTSLRPVGRPVA